MSTFDTAIPSTDDARAAARRFALPLFAGVLFVSALLLFAVQPMFTKMVLPRLGGSPSVWSTAMVVFQGLLFGGYLYAHLLVRSLAPGRAAMVHVLLLACVAMVLPLGIAAGFERPPESGVTAWLVALFALSIGLPFVALSATAPLLQNWFIATGHPQAKNPYVLYAASNLGSFAALLAYPFVIEPFFTLRTQNAMWAYGFAILALGICAAGAMVVGRAGATRAEPIEAAPAASRRLAWMGLTAIPAGLCIAVTAYITTDLAAAPFLWVLPLALYLLTFVGVFRERPWIPHAWVLKLVPYVIAPVAISVLGGTKSHWLAVIVLNLTAFVLIALACHGEAYRQRPEPARLTEFYLWTSFGGVIGGVFAGLIAPNVFNNTYEYPILIAVALLVLPGAFDGGVRHFLRQSGPWLALAALAIGSRFAFDFRLPLAAELPIHVTLVVLAALMLFQAKKPARFFGLAVLAMTFTASWQAGMRPLETVRSFFGVHQVVETTDRTHHMLFHGTTVHGAEHVRDEAGRPVEGKPLPLTYYYSGSPLSDVIDSARKLRGSVASAALVGLGTGSLACQARDGERWTFFEIDPEVIRLSRDPKNFRFLSECGNPDIVVGDARLTLAASPQRYNVIVLDAFSSDAIPVHLLTREALAGFASRLEPGGVIALHVSNRHMELASVVAAVAAEEGFVTYFKRNRDANAFLKDFRANSDVVVLARTPADLGDLPQRAGWEPLATRPDVAAWTDDYSDVLRSIMRKKLGW
jgi:hypothetical protein